LTRDSAPSEKVGRESLLHSRHQCQFMRYPLTHPMWVDKRLIDTLVPALSGLFPLRETTKRPDCLFALFLQFLAAFASFFALQRNYPHLHFQLLARTLVLFSFQFTL